MNSTQRSRKWREINGERDKTNMQKWREEHPEYVKNWRLKHPDWKVKASAQQRKRRQDNIAKYILKFTKARAKKRKREFSLTIPWIEKKLTAGVCERTGLSFDYKLGIVDCLDSRNPYFPSIDRIDSSLGYTETNCQLVCVIYNYAKNEWRDADVLKMAIALVNKNDPLA